MTREKKSQEEATSSRNERLEPKLVRAVDSNDEASVQHIIAEARSRQQCTEKFLALGLNRACDKDLVSLAQLLLNNGANPNYASGHKLSGLLRAVEFGRAQIAETLLRAKADIHARDKAGRSALLIAAFEGHAQVVKLLIAYGAKIDEDRDKKGRTALMTAAWRGHGQTVRLLLTEGANVDNVDYRQRNVLHNLAADRGEAQVEPRSSGKVKRKFDLSIVNIILQAGVNIDAQDELGRTALHWTCVTDNEELMKVLLITRLDGQSPKARLDMTDLREKTPLHLATSHNRPRLVQILLDHGADVGATSDGGWAPLHNACTVGSHEMVQILLNANAEVNGELLSGKTPLHVAAEFGNSDAAECLLKNKCKRSIKDRLGNTPLLMAAQVSDRDRELAQSGDSGKQDLLQRKKAIVEMLAPWNHMYELSDDEVMAAERFRATIVDFGDYPNGNRVDRKSVHDVLYGRDKATGTKNSVSTLRDRRNMKDNDFSWIHLPVNSIPWCEALLTKRFIEEGAVDVEGYKALETAFTHQHKGQKHHSQFMRHMCQVTHRSTFDDEPPRSEDATPYPRQNILDPHLLTSVPETTIGGATDGQLTSSDREHLSDSTQRPRSSRSVAVPELRLESTDPPNLTMNRQDTMASESSTNSRRKTSAGRLLRRRETSSTMMTSDSSIPSKPSGRNPKPQKRTVSKEPKARTERSSRAEKSSTPGPSMSAQKSCNIFMFMPYLHFEDHQRRKEMQMALDDPETLRKLGPRACADEILFRAHQQKSTSFLHIRRTLDQFFYHNIDTQMRDEDQVVYRFQQQQRNGNPMIFMVDQLWIFVLGKDLVVTSFWQRWRQPRKDPLNVLEGIIEDINSKTREPVTNVYELAMTIAARCYGSFDRHRKSDHQYQFLDMFGGSLGAAMDREATLFREFSDASKQASTWLSTHQRQEPAFVDKLLNIEGETSLLAEIKDIRDELEMLALVLDQQKHVVPDLKKVIKDLYINDRSLGQLRKLDRAFQEQERTITNPLKDIHRMDKQAERIYQSIRDLLDLKQKHANAFEARFARDQAVGTRRQGKTILVFTLITCIFLPLSFISSFFAINIETFPHSPQTGNPALPLGFVSKYVFGVGLAISVPCIVLALTVAELGDAFDRVRRRFPDRLWRGSDGHKIVQEEHKLQMVQREGAREMAKSYRRSVEVSWNGRAHSKVRRSEESTWEMVVPKRRHLAWDEERGRRMLHAS